MKLVIVVGARPQFIKCAPLAKKNQNNHELIIINSGQHYDENMSDVFFNEMKIPKPDYDLGISSGLHGEQTAKILAETEPILLDEKPDYVIVFGDTNTTLAATLAATKLCIPVVHIESGLRSYDRAMPEEQNRVVTDHLASLLACPTQTAVDNLAKEGIIKGVIYTGDLMFDAIKLYKQMYESREIVSKYSDFSMLTLHRPSNVDNKEQLIKILKVLDDLGHHFIFPIHPRTRKKISDFGILLPKNIEVINPLGYLDMMAMTSKANTLFTDSGGLQKEAFFLDVKCVTLRDTTEWVETITENANFLALDSYGNIDNSKLVEFLSKPKIAQKLASPYGNGDAADKILKALI